MASYFRGGTPDNVVAMTTAENQVSADIRIPELLKVKARRHGVSIEPLLGPVKIREHLMAGIDPGRCVNCGKGKKAAGRLLDGREWSEVPR